MAKVDAFIDHVPNYRIENQIMYIEAEGWTLAMPLHVFKRGHAKSARVMAEYEARLAEVVPLKRKKGSPGEH